MKRLLYQLAQQGDIEWLSYHFARFIADHASVSIDSELCLSAALLCQANDQGSVCIDLSSLAEEPLFNSNAIDAASIPIAPDLASWNQLLMASNLVGKPDQRTPMTLEDNLLYLNRFWYYENFVATAIGTRIAQDFTHNPSISEARIDSQLELLFSGNETIDSDQRQAIRIAASKSFSVVSGGPGSGKTSTVVRMLALLLMLDPGCRIALAAPTGKAAARMTDSIRQRVDQMNIRAEIKDAMSAEAATIHRLLGFRYYGFTYDERHRLPVDCLVVDEASMIDLKLMFHLLSALPDHCRLVLLGDRDQLASVAAGNVMGDITGHGTSVTDKTIPINSVITLLSKNYRFNEDSAIGELATCVNRGECAAAIDLLQSRQRGLNWYPETSNQLHGEALSWLLDAYRPIFKCATAVEALEVYNSTRALCVTNQGPFGVDELNQKVSAAILSQHQLPQTDLFNGLPIMISQNQHDLSLFNGDTGILWQFDQELRACFLDATGKLRDFALHRLPAFVPAWATTVHKSQGSEFDSVLLVMPADSSSDLLSRELIYTAITRARSQFILHAESTVLVSAIQKITRRHSGLARKLGWPTGVR